MERPDSILQLELAAKTNRIAVLSECEVQDISCYIQHLEKQLDSIAIETCKHLPNIRLVHSVAMGNTGRIHAGRQTNRRK